MSKKEKYVFVTDNLDPLLKEIQGLFHIEDSQICFVSLQLLLIPSSTKKVEAKKNEL